jgi:hypothetical protein
MPEKDQVQVPPKDAGQSVKKPSFDESFDRGWDQVELLTNQENEAKARAAKPEPAEKTDTDKELGKPTSDKAPFRVLKVQGKDLPVYSEDELIELAQKGADYTKKTQALAEDRRTAEQQLKGEEKRLADAAFDLNKTLDQLSRMKAGKKTDEPTEDGEAKDIPPEEAKIYGEYGIDPKFAQAHEIKIVKDLAEVKSQIKEIRAEKADAEIRKIIAKERETYPYEDVVDDQGQSITETQLASIVTAKRKAAEAASEKPDPTKWLKEAVREVHLSQKKIKDTLTPEVSDAMDPDVFLTKFPSLADKLKEKFGTVAKTREAVPPSLPATRREPTMPPKQKAVSPTGKSLNDWLEEGFRDPETIKALTGE